ncbi:hypothetical protein FHX14_000503 [Rhizobium sp. BK619]|uniref:Uncharacterized protein n=1 Tax=Rhizobium acidisoli TaxID=1538158 RepID=A0AAE6C4Z3_9HYPH|nr:hypothetical protein [Rhizobium acidisoli]KPH06254.1 hypothetical protein AOG23_23820 [Rhizobium acidisoli]MBB3644344.1 hypothetical protein [Rhizobium sp. BK619]QAS82140.1 hypothetical protein CO657_30165 [Rhizobium acidisoli]
MAIAGLVPGKLYWASSWKHFDGKITVVEVSSVFGEDPDYWTVAVIGSDQHYMLGDFEFIAIAEPPHGIPMRYAAE